MKGILDLFAYCWRTAMLVAAVALALGGAILWHVRNQGGAKPSSDQITVVSAPVDEVGHGLARDRKSSMPAPATLDVGDVNQLVMRYLPLLRDVRSECDTQTCIVSAEPSAAGQPLDEQAFSQLVREDMPTILSRTGHGLLEPIQIEEVGPDQYRLRFRIPRQAR